MVKTYRIATSGGRFALSDFISVPSARVVRHPSLVAIEKLTNGSISDSMDRILDNLLSNKAIHIFPSFSFDSVLLVKD